LASRTQDSTLLRITEITVVLSLSNSCKILQGEN